MTRRLSRMAAASVLAIAALAGCSAHRLPAATAAIPPHPEQHDIATLAAIHSRSSDRGMVLAVTDGLFDAGKTDLKADGRRDLAAIAEYLKAHGGQRVLIEGHSDDTGHDVRDHELALRRATAVETFLLKSGVDPTRLEVRGLGATKPMASYATRAGRRQNRRVDIVLLHSAADQTVCVDQPPSDAVRR